MVFKMAVLISLSFCAAQSTTKPKPNFLFVLADDFGHYDVGWRNPEVTSPTLDMLARSGIILNRHYVYKYCSVSALYVYESRLGLGLGLGLGCVVCILVATRCRSIFIVQHTV